MASSCGSFAAKTKQAASILLLVFTQMLMLIYTKRATNREKLPLTLCVSQFLVSAVLSSLLLPLVLNQPKKAGIKYQQQQRGILLPIPLLLHSLIPLSLCWTFGFVLFNASASLMSPAYVNLVRCSEPLVTVLIGLLLLGKRYNRWVLFTLVPICGGVILASSSSSSSATASASVGGILLACLSNVSFCVRSIVLHRMKRHPIARQQQPHDLVVFFHVVLIACFVLPWVVFLWEGDAVRQVVLRFLLSSSDDDDDKSERILFVKDVLWSSLFFFFYQFLQLQVMTELSPLAFSILTPVIKACMIVLCSWYFQDPPFGIVSAIGVLTTTGGGYLFTTLQSGKQQPQPRHQTMMKNNHRVLPL